MSDNRSTFVVLNIMPHGPLVTFPLACEDHDSPVSTVVAHSDGTYSVQYACTYCGMMLGGKEHRGVMLELLEAVSDWTYIAVRSPWFWFALLNMFAIAIWAGLDA